MNHESVTLKMHNQQKIKNRLCNIEMQQVQPASFHYRQYYMQKPLIKKQSDFHQLSDWANNFETHLQQPVFDSPNQPELEKDNKRFTFLNTTRYQSSLLSSNNNKTQRLQLSPIVVKFNAKVLTQNLQRSREKFIKKLKEDPYLTRYQSLNLLYKKEKKQVPQQRFQELHLKDVANANSQQLHPKTERISSIFRLMKKQEVFRIRHKKQANPENLVATRMMF